MPGEITRADQKIQPINTYNDYQQREGVPVVRGFAVPDLRKIDLQPWARKGGRGCFVTLDGTAGTNDAYLCEIAPGKSLNPQRQIFEEMVFILDGSGATTVWYQEDRKVNFEWNAGSLFAIPINAWHQHHNGSGQQPARYIAVTNAPIVINMFHNLDFVFGNPFVFDDRFGAEGDYFDGSGILYPGRALQTNFVPDVSTMKLYDMPERGAGGTQVSFEMAGNVMAAHVAQFPVGTYKKAHRHAPGAHLVVLSGKGYSLLWPPEGGEITRADWQTGSLVVPPNQWFHQHFNSGAEPARYLALRWNSKRYDLGPLFTDFEGTTVDQKAGGAQIEFEDEDPSIHRMFEEEMAKAGAPCRMAGEVPWCTAG